MENLKEKLMSDIQTIFDTDGLSVEYESGDTECVVSLDSALCCIEESDDIDRLVKEDAELREAVEDFESVLSRVMLECSMSNELSEDIEKLLNQIGESE